MNSSIINAQRNAHTDNRLRIRFRCIEWDHRSRFTRECDGSLDVGEYVSGTLSGESVTNILIETGSRSVGAIHERE
jgi:hypothetical protein